MNKVIKNLRDEELILQFCANKDSDAFAILYQRYSHLVYGVNLKYLKHEEDAKDATTQVFEKLIAEICRHDIQLFKAWLYRVAKNHCLMNLRNRRHETKLVGEFDELNMEFVDNMHLAIEKEKMLSRMEDAMKELGIEQQQCIYYFYIDKMTYSEIMNKTGFTFMQVKSFIQNGKRNLKQKLTQKMSNE